MSGVGFPLVTTLTIRPVRPEELTAVGALTVAAFQADKPSPEGYASTLADAQTRALHTGILVAADGQDRLIGAVALVLHGGPYAELSLAADEAEFRMLAVDPQGRGQGVGTALIEECLARARAAGKRRMVISTGEKMTAARRRYEALGFCRAAELDWSPEPGMQLLAYVLELGESTG